MCFSRADTKQEIVTMTPEALDSFWGNHIKITINQKDLDLSKAKEIAKEEAKNWHRTRCCSPFIREKPGVFSQINLQSGTSRFG